MTEIAILDENKIKEEHTALERRAFEMAATIKSDADYNQAGEFLVGIKKAMRVWDLKIEPIVEAGLQAHRKALALKKEIRLPLEKAERTIKPALAKYDQQKEEERKKEQERINAQLRAEAEARRKAAEEERKKNELILPDGLKHEVNESVNTGEVPQVVLPKQQTPKGVSYFDYYSAEVSDIVALLKAILGGKVPVDAITPNRAFLNQRVQILKDSMQWPGISVRKERRVRMGNLR